MVISRSYNFDGGREAVPAIFGVGVVSVGREYLRAVEVAEFGNFSLMSGIDNPRDCKS